jgi:hypothetical protein
MEYTEKEKVIVDMIIAELEEDSDYPFDSEYRTELFYKILGNLKNEQLHNI